MNSPKSTIFVEVTFEIKSTATNREAIASKCLYDFGTVLELPWLEDLCFNQLVELEIFLILAETIDN